MDRVVGAFIFPEIWQAWSTTQASRMFDSLAGFGVNTVCTESETYRDDLIEICHRHELKWFGGIGCFSDHSHSNQIVRERPELWPVGEDGNLRPEMEWYLGITPTFEDYNESRIRLAEQLVRTHSLDGFFLDFIRWPLHWELELRPSAPLPLSYSFDPHSLERFQNERAISIPTSLQNTAEAAAWILTHHRQEWTDFKCRVITNFVQQTSQRLRALRPESFSLGLFALPMSADELESYAGQRLQDLIPLVDYVAPMVYHAIIHRPVDWAVRHVDKVLQIAGSKTLPILQVDSAEGAASGADWGPPIPPSEWAQLVSQITTMPSLGGIIVFTGTALFQDHRGEILRRSL